MTGADQTMIRIGEGLALSQRGERAAARALFDRIWQEIGPGGDPLHRCALAHSMADVQDDPSAELAWDLRALEAAGGVTDERVRRAGMPGTARALLPSLHLNLGEAYRKLGELDLARAHLASGSAALDALADDGYGRQVRDGLNRLAGRLSAAPTGPHT